MISDVMPDEAIIFVVLSVHCSLVVLHASATLNDFFSDFPNENRQAI
jgi:hypothetical protein